MLKLLLKTRCHLSFFVSSSHIIFISMLGLLSNSSLPSICADSFRRLTHQYSSSIFISFCRAFSYSATLFPPYMISHARFHSLALTINFWCSSSLTFRKRFVSPLYCLPQLQGNSKILVLDIKVAFCRNSQPIIYIQIDRKFFKNRVYIHFLYEARLNTIVVLPIRLQKLTAAVIQIWSFSYCSSSSINTSPYTFPYMF